MLCYVILSKVVPCPLPSFFMLFFWALSRSICFLYNLLEGQPEDSWPLEGKCCKISNPTRYLGFHLLCFLQHVCQQYLLVNPLGWVTGTQCLLEVNLLVASLQGQLGFQGQCLPFWGLAQQAIWAQTLTTLLLKLKTYALDQIYTPLLWNIWYVASHQFVLKPLTNSYNQDPAPL